MRKMDLTGNVYGRLTVLEEAEKTEYGQSRWLCACECGTQKVIRGCSLVHGESLSCGCRKLEPNLKNRKHGESNSPVYRVWSSMLSRCQNPNHRAYANYGGRGIKVCPQWQVFENFLADMGKPPEGLSLDRMDNDGNYEPANCRWATRSEQARNIRSLGRISTKTQVQLAQELGISIKTVRIRQRAGLL